MWRDPAGVTWDARWPETEEALRVVQAVLGSHAAAVRRSQTWIPGSRPLVGGCFVTFARERAAGGLSRTHAFAAAVAWRPPASLREHAEPYRHSDGALRGSRDAPRRARDLEDQVVAEARVAAPYVPGLLALRHGAVLAEAVARLRVLPDVLLVNATGVDHPRGAGLALHLGAMLGLPTVGVTHRPMLASGALPESVRGRTSPVMLDDEIVGCWVCTRSGARPVLAHAAWRTTPETAACIALLASTQAARTPVPLQEARRVAREARALAEGRGG